MKYKAVTFDMDGVLVDSETKYIDSVDEFFAGFLRVQPTKEQRMSVIGASTMTNARNIKQWFPDLPYTESELYHLYQDMIFNTLRNKVGSLIDGIDDWISRLGSAGMKMAVATSSPRRVAEYAGIKYNLNGRMDAIICGDDVERSKPAPDIFLLAAERIGVSPADCLVIEDSQNGVNAAKAAGMDCALFRGFPGPVEVTGGEYIITKYDGATFDMLFGA